MPSLKALRLRISSVKSTQKITSAMKMVAAAKLRRAQEQAEASRPYAERMERLTSSLATKIAVPPSEHDHEEHDHEEEEAPFEAEAANDLAPDEEEKPDPLRLVKGSGKDTRQLILIVTADRGLCGNFNASITRSVKPLVNKLLQEGKEVKLLCIGRKGRDLLRRDFGPLIVDTIENVARPKLTFATAYELTQRIRDMFDRDEIDVCSVVYNKFKSAMTQVVTRQQLIPVPVPEMAGAGDPAAEEAWGSLEDEYDYEPTEEEVFAELLPQNLAIQVYRSLLESNASEHGARMTAMDSATRNAGEMIKKLTIQYNRARQANITKELIEIISGAEAL